MKCHEEASDISYFVLRAEIVRARKRISLLNKFLGSKSATMTQSAPTTILSNHHLALELSRCKIKR